MNLGTSDRQDSIRRDDNRSLSAELSRMSYARFNGDGQLGAINNGSYQWRTVPNKVLAFGGDPTGSNLDVTC